MNLTLAKITTTAELNALLGNERSEYRDAYRATMRMKAAQIIGISFAKAVAQRINECDAMNIHSIY